MHDLVFKKELRPDWQMTELLLLADPSMELIESYINHSELFTASIANETIGVFVLLPNDTNTIEIKNIAVRTDYQGIGLGKRLLEKACEVSAEMNFNTVKIATGNSSIGQLALYQKQGFELKGITPDFFIDHYSQPIFENGIQCKHLILLEKNL